MSDNVNEIQMVALDNRGKIISIYIDSVLAEVDQGVRLELTVWLVRCESY